MLEIITKERLKEYQEDCKYLNWLYDTREILRKKAGAVAGLDYSRIKVTSGNGNKSSQEEMFAGALWDKNKKIDELEKHLARERFVISSQLCRIKKRLYRDIIRLRYLENKSWNEIIFNLFAEALDYELYANSKFHFYTMYWHRRAVNEFEKATKTPFIPEKTEKDEQLYIFD